MPIISDIYNYDTGYVGLMIPIPEGLPGLVNVAGYELTLKTEFHITLINAKATATAIDQSKVLEIESEIIDLFRSFITKYPLENYKILPQFRFVQRDTRKTLIAMAKVAYLSNFFDQISDTYKVTIPIQPTHITIYTLQPERGIGILSPEELARDSAPLQVPELENLQFVKNL